MEEIINYIETYIYKIYIELKKYHKKIKKYVKENKKVIGFIFIILLLLLVIYFLIQNYNNDYNLSGGAELIYKPKRNEEKIEKLKPQAPVQQKVKPIGRTMSQNFSEINSNHQKGKLDILKQKFDEKSKKNQESKEKADKKARRAKKNRNTPTAIISKMSEAPKKAFKQIFKSLLPIFIPIIAIIGPTSVSTIKGVKDLNRTLKDL